MSEQVVMTLIYAAMGLLFMLIAVPLIQGKVRRNPWYGFRVPKTMKSDAVWYPANWYMGKQLFHAGRFIVFGSLVMLLFAGHLSKETVGYLGTALTTIPLTVAVIRSFRYLGKL